MSELIIIINFTGFKFPKSMVLWELGSARGYAALLTTMKLIFFYTIDPLNTPIHQSHIYGPCRLWRNASQANSPAVLISVS